MNKNQEKGASSCKKKLYEVLKCSLACIYAVFCTVTIKMTWLFYTFQAQATCFDFVALGESLEKLILLKALPFLLFLLRSLKKKKAWVRYVLQKTKECARSLSPDPCRVPAWVAGLLFLCHHQARHRLQGRSSWDGALPSRKATGRGYEGTFLLVNRLRHRVICCGR